MTQTQLTQLLILCLRVADSQAARSISLNVAHDRVGRMESLARQTIFFLMHILPMNLQLVLAGEAILATVLTSND